MASLIRELGTVHSDDDRRAIVVCVLTPLDRFSLREYDFVEKLRSELQRDAFPLETAKSAAFALAQHVKHRTEDFIFSAYDSSLELVLAVAQRLSATAAINEFLLTCIAIAKDNHFAARVTDRFGPGDNDLHDPPSRSDIHAFFQWVKVNEEERSKEIAYWVRFVGASRRRLAEAFSRIAPPDTFWTKESGAAIEELIPIATLRRMFAETLEDGPLEEIHQQTIDLLGRFLRGELPSGQSSTPDGAES